MSTAITEGIQVFVKNDFYPEYSDIEKNQFFFSYQVEIQNKSPYVVQLLSREWYVFDSMESFKVVSGTGVIGQQPIIEPGEVYSYRSGCMIHSEIGYMEGHYTFVNKSLDTTFLVEIPRFDLYYPGILN